MASLMVAIRRLLVKVIRPLVTPRAVDTLQPKVTPRAAHTLHLLKVIPRVVHILRLVLTRRKVPIPQHKVPTPHRVTLASEERTAIGEMPMVGN